MKNTIICLAAVVVTALISGVPIAYGQEDCPQGANLSSPLIMLYHLQSFDRISQTLISPFSGMY